MKSDGHVREDPQHEHRRQVYREVTDVDRLTAGHPGRAVSGERQLEPARQLSRGALNRQSTGDSEAAGAQRRDPRDR